MENGGLWGKAGGQGLDQSELCESVLNTVGDNRKVRSED